jgi:hypothetical protein
MQTTTIIRRNRGSATKPDGTADGVRRKTRAQVAGLHRVPKPTRQPEPVFEDSIHRHPFGRELRACSETGLLGRTPYFYKKMAISFAQHARRRFHWFGAEEKRTHTDLAKMYLRSYREILAKCVGKTGRSESLA